MSDPRRHALVIGAGGRLGTVLAERLHEADYGLHLWYKNSSGGAARAHDNGRCSHALDLGDAAAVETATNDLVSLAQTFQVVVNAAGVWTDGALTKLRPADIERHLSAVVAGSINAARAAISMLAGDGVFVQIAAASAKPGYADTALNTLAKRAQDGLQEALVRELRLAQPVGAPKRVRMTTIYPDFIAPQGTEAVAMGAAMSYEDVAETIMFVIGASPTVDVREIVLTAPNGGRWAAS
jgi:NAD(P)-dependent dehydrogenase (short-subunit alcohol dehydrogenase family)